MSLVSQIQSNEYMFSFQILSNIILISSPILARAIFTSDPLIKITYEFEQLWYVRVTCSSDVIPNDAFTQYYYVQSKV